MKTILQQIKHTQKKGKDERESNTDTKLGFSQQQKENVRENEKMFNCPAALFFPGQLYSMLIYFVGVLFELRSFIAF